MFLPNSEQAIGRIIWHDESRQGSARNRGNLPQSVDGRADCLGKGRAALAQQTEAVRQAASAVLVVIRKAVGEAVGVSMKEALAGISGEAAKALGEAAKPVI